MSVENLTPKERAYLRSLANTIPAIFQYGKDGLSENFVKQIDAALETRELIKISLLETADCTAKELAPKICEAANCQSVQIIGRKIVFYRQAKDPDKRTISLDGKPIEKKKAKPAAKKTAVRDGSGISVKRNPFGGNHGAPRYPKKDK